MDWTSYEDELWGTVFTCAKEFGWNPHYVIYELPLLWLRKISGKMVEHAEMEAEAAKGHKPIPKSETSPERLEQKDRLLAKARGLNYDEVLSNNVFG
jgi:hypothetical protein